MKVSWPGLRRIVQWIVVALRVGLDIDLSNMAVINLIVRTLCQPLRVLPIITQYNDVGDLNVFWSKNTSKTNNYTPSSRRGQRPIAPILPTLRPS
jgi:hypothetical protein